MGDVAIVDDVGAVRQRERGGEILLDQNDGLPGVGEIAAGLDEIAIEGDIKAKDCLLRYKKNGRVLAVASIFRDIESLQAELAMEQTPA